MMINRLLEEAQKGFGVRRACNNSRVDLPLFGFGIHLPTVKDEFCCVLSDLKIVGIACDHRIITFRTWVIESHVLTDTRRKTVINVSPMQREIEQELRHWSRTNPLPRQMIDHGGVRTPTPQRQVNG